MGARKFASSPHHSLAGVELRVGFALQRARRLQAWEHSRHAHSSEGSSPCPLHIHLPSSAVHCRLRCTARPVPQVQFGIALLWGGNQVVQASLLHVLQTSSGGFCHSIAIQLQERLATLRQHRREVEFLNNESALASSAVILDDGEIEVLGDPGTI